MAVHLTFDIDWAPDWAVLETLNILERYRVSATYFCTHKTCINELIIERGHNIGLHPNFLPGSSQGSSPREIMNMLLSIAPEAKCLRTHALVQSTTLLNEVFGNYPQLKYDFSLYTPGIPLTRFIDWNFSDASFRRINYQWEDDGCFYIPDYRWNDIEVSSPYFVMDFHPIHVVLNSCSNEGYKGLKCALGGVPLMDTSITTAENFINKGLGVRDGLVNILETSKCISFEDLVCGLE